MSVPQWILMIVLGAIMGLLGQTVRVVVGLKKVKDQAASSGQAFTEAFEASTLLISLLIGAAAGALAALFVKSDATLARETLLGLAAAGYSGADFIEGIMAKYLPAGQAPSTANALLPIPAPSKAPASPLVAGSVTPLP